MSETTIPIEIETSENVDRLEADMESRPASLSPRPDCEMCNNYEANLTRLQEAERELREKLTAAKQLADRYENELSGERVYRKELEDNFRTLGSDVEKRVTRFQTEHQTLIDKLIAMENKHKLCYDKMVREYTTAAQTCTGLENDIVCLKNKYLHLLGLKKEKAAELRDQPIDLPQTVEQLQFLCLQLREDLIEDRAAKEHIIADMRDQLTVTKEQLREEHTDKRRIEAEMGAQINAISHELGIARSKLNAVFAENKEMYERQKMSPAYQQRIEELESQVEKLQHERQTVDRQYAECRQKCHTLQMELDTSETVQKDFVILSQSLQIQLEKIRQAEQEVRWQFDDDVFNCNSCEAEFSTKLPKMHCYHCGKIFCPNCLSHTIPSGPHRRPAKVCNVCHTLLNRESAPFFSKSGNSN
uniref:FYVE-type domain-containing protein n=1 Tax=Panagrolaimus sp. ES5 TaxID=591445 RepID=A0AC34GRY8_9BILA